MMSIASYTRRIDHYKPSSERAQAGEMRYVEGQEVGHTVNVADRHQPGVVDSFADYTQCRYQSLPGRENIRRLHQEWEGCLKGRRLRFCVHGRQAQAVRSDRSCCYVAEFYQVLSGYVQDFAAPVQFEHGAGSDHVQHIPGVRQSAEDAGIDQMGHYS
jgi:hypothetical protein